MLNNSWFQGNVRIYLEGQKALLPISIHPPYEMGYFIGSQNTNLIIKDFRQVPNLAAERVIIGDKDFDFAEVFNQPAWADVSEEDGTLEINLYEALSDGDFPILWLGVIRDGKMPVHDLAWEVLRPADETAIAFAALVKP